MFVDEVDVTVAAGDGGRGSVSFRREKFVPRGGPDGGDGGPGGSVYLVGSPHLNTLVKFRYHPDLRAQRGAHGQGAKRTGRTGSDLIIDLPIGTVAYARHPDGQLVEVADLAQEGVPIRVAKGGRGGRGNTRFVSSTNQAPRRADPGEAGEIVTLHLRLKLLADVGLVGFPNAGKSTLISRISAARPKIADYPFTTLVPNLGVVDLGDDRSFVVADVPGLIEGAHAGHGLGHRFLGHVERTRVLVHLVDVSSTAGRDPVDDFEIIQRELALYAPETDAVGHAGVRSDAGDERSAGADAMGRPTLADRPQIVAPNKIDAIDDPERLARLSAHVRARGLECHPISAATGAGVPELLEAVWRRLRGEAPQPGEMEPGEMEPGEIEPGPSEPAPAE
jgi:GTP-binding protein